MKMNVMLQNASENLVIPQQFSKIDRRKDPRFILSDYNTSIPVRINDQPQSSSTIINISCNGMVIECSKQYKLYDRLSVVLALPGSSEAHCSGRIMWAIPSEDRFVYGLNLYYFENEEHNRIFRDFIVSLKPDMRLLDRRRNDRRGVVKKDTGENNRKNDRRITKPFFLKCLRYDRLKKAVESGHYYFLREQESGATNRIMMKGVEKINFSSNNYLGLSTHPAVIEASVKAAEKYGIGTGGSRILSGTFDLHRQLEMKLADMKNGEDCMVYTTGYSTNVGVISGLIDLEDHLLLDSKCHASMIDGCTLGGGKINLFKHNDMNDLRKHLEKASKNSPKVIMTEGIFSMDGDIGRLDDMYRLGEEHQAVIIIDDAHATGILGKQGRGTPEYFGLEGKIEVVIGTLSKAIGCLGGFVVAKKKVIEYLRHNSRSFIFSTSLPAPDCAASLAALEIIEKEPERREMLWRNIRYFREKVVKMGYEIGATDSPIIPVIIGNENKTFEMTGMLDQQGLYISPVTYPAVKKSESRLRLSLMATHTLQEIDCLLDNLKSAGQRLGVI